MGRKAENRSLFNFRKGAVTGMDISLLIELVRSTTQTPSKLPRQAPCGKGTVLVEGKNFLGSEKLITVRADTSTQGFPEHTHDYIEIVYMCQGQTEHIVNGEMVVLAKGDFLFLSQNSRQENLPSGKDDIAVNFIVHPDFMKQILVMLGEKETMIHRFIIECLTGDTGKATFLHFSASNSPAVQNLVENLIWNHLYETPYSDKINELTMSLLLIHLMNNVEGISYNGSGNSLVFKMLDYIENNYADGSLTRLSELTFYDVNALSKQIKRLTGKNYTQFLQEKRISKACSLLKNTDMGIKEIAQQVGYDNISYFHRLFSKTCGMSPKKYRDREKRI